MKKELENKLDELARRYFGDDKKSEKDDIWKPKFDLKKPPGLVGEVTDYINSQCRFPQENLSVLSALVAVGNIGGLNHTIDNQRLTSNLLGFGIAGSSTGKESVLQAFNDLHIVAGMSAAVHGSIKSEQEIVRNLIRNQAAFYNNDEFGIFLRKLHMSDKTGGASYLQGVIGMIMSAYSKASGNLLLSGDVKEEIKQGLNRELAALNKKMDSGDATAATEARMQSIKDSLSTIDQGLSMPFLSINAFSTPSTFNEAVSFEAITNGFIGRAIIVNEPETNPRPKRDFEYCDMPGSLRSQIIGLCANGEYNIFDNRVESRGEKIQITTTPEAQKALQNASDWVFDEADKHAEQTGFEAVIRRSYECLEKVSFILSMGGEQYRTLEHVEWAFEYIRRDIEYKTTLAYSNVKEKSDPVKSMAAKIMCSIGPDGITVGRLINKYRAKKSLVEDAVELLISKDKIYTEYRQNKFNKSEALFIFAK